MSKKKDIESELIDFWTLYPPTEMEKFIRDVIPLVDMFEKYEDEEWLNEAPTLQETLNIKLIRGAYIMSRIAELHAGRMCRIKNAHGDFWKRLEGKANELQQDTQIGQSTTSDEGVLQPTG